MQQATLASERAPKGLRAGGPRTVCLVVGYHSGAVEATEVVSRMSQCYAYTQMTQEDLTGTDGDGERHVYRC